MASNDPRTRATMPDDDAVKRFVAMLAAHGDEFLRSGFPDSVKEEFGTMIAGDADEVPEPPC